MTDIYWSARKEDSPGNNELGKLMERVRDGVAGSEANEGFIALMTIFFGDRM